MFLRCQAEDHRSEPIPRSVAAKYQQTNPRQGSDGAYLCVKIIKRKNTKYQQTNPRQDNDGAYLCVKIIKRKNKNISKPILIKTYIFV